MARLTEEKIALIQQTYLQVGTYSGTAKIVGCSPATVKKYVEMDRCPEHSIQSKKISCDVPISTSFIGQFNPNINWADLCILSEEEKTNIQATLGEFI